MWYRDGCDGLDDLGAYLRDGLATDAASDLDEALKIIDAQALALRTVREERDEALRSEDAAGDGWGEAVEANKLVLAEMLSLRADVARLTATKDDAYLERNHLVAALAHLFPSGTRATDIPGWSPDWHGCVTIDLPSGQISYHYHDSHAHLFADLPPYTKPWDGHDKATVHQRLAELKPTHAEQQVRALRASIEQLQRHDLSVTAYYPEQAIPNITVAEKVVKWAELSALLAAIKEP